MQKVEGSSPFIRLIKKPRKPRGFFFSAVEQDAFFSRRYHSALPDGRPPLRRDT